MGINTIRAGEKQCKCQILNPLSRDGLVSVLHRNSVQHRACTALISTHDTSESLRLWGLRQRPRSCPACRAGNGTPATQAPEKDSAFLPSRERRRASCLDFCEEGQIFRGRIFSWNLRNDGTVIEGVCGRLTSPEKPGSIGYQACCLLSPPGLLAVEAQAMRPRIVVPFRPLTILKRQVVGLLLHEPHAHGVLDRFVFAHGCLEIAPILIVPRLPAWNVPWFGLWIPVRRRSRRLLGVIKVILHNKQFTFGKHLLQEDALAWGVYKRVIPLRERVQVNIPDHQRNSHRMQRS